mgnify:CR=1 FL=1
MREFCSTELKRCMVFCNHWSRPRLVRWIATPIKAAKPSRARRLFRVFTWPAALSNMSQEQQPIVVPAAQEPQSSALIMLHGRGDSAAGWAHLAAVLSPGLPHTTFIFPNATVVRRLALLGLPLFDGTVCVRLALRCG